MTTHLDIAKSLTPGRTPDYIGDESALEVAIAQAHALIDIAESLRTIATRPEIQIVTGPLAGTPTTPDGPVEAAIETIARSVLADAAETAVATQWETHDGIGEHDWTRVADAMERLAPHPQPYEFAAAYKLLGDRADHE